MRRFAIFPCKLQYGIENQQEVIVTAMALTVPDMLSYLKHYVRINHS